MKTKDETKNWEEGLTEFLDSWIENYVYQQYIVNTGRGYDWDGFKKEAGAFIEKEIEKARLEGWLEGYGYRETLYWKIVSHGRDSKKAQETAVALFKKKEQKLSKLNKEEE